MFYFFSEKDTEDEKDMQENFEAQLLEQMGQVSDQKWFATKIGKEQGASPERSKELFATKTGKEKNEVVKDLN